MKLGVIGVGDAGSRLANEILAFEKRSGRNLTNGNVLLVNSNPPTFDSTDHVPEERRLIIGDVSWEVDRPTLDSDPDLAAKVAREEVNEIIRAVDLLEFTDIDGVLVVAGLAGGTGGGAGAVVIEQLQSICDDPIYGLGVLPREREGQRAALTASRTLQSFVDKADNVIVFDNDAWDPEDRYQDAVRDVADETATDGPDAPETETETDTDDTAVEPSETSPADADEGESADEASPSVTAETSTAAADVDEAEVAAHYAEQNAALAERLVTLLAAGEFGGMATSEYQLDPSDLMRALDTGGLSSIGFAAIDLPSNGGLDGWLSSLRAWLPFGSDAEDDEDPMTDAARINSLVRRAARSKLTLPCAVSSADRAVIVVSGPSRTLSRKGFESGRYWLETEADIVDVMAGDEPHERTTQLTAVVLFSNVTDVPRIEAMHETALSHLDTASAADERETDTDAETDDGWRFDTANP